MNHKLIEIPVDDRFIKGFYGQPLLPLLRKEGFDIPSLCHHDSVAPYGGCRICLVEIIDKKGRKKLTTSCNFPVMESIRVRTESEEITRHRKMVLELMIARAPKTPVLEELCKKYGANQNRLEFPCFTEPCILCGLCVRVCNEVVGAGVLTITGRGAKKRIGTSFGELPDSCIGCGLCANVCPTGAVTTAMKAMESFRCFHGPDRLCRYALMGLTPGAVCAKSYECESCEVEHRIAHQMGEHPMMLKKRPDLDPVKTFLEERKRARLK